AAAASHRERQTPRQRCKSRSLILPARGGCQRADSSACGRPRSPFLGLLFPHIPLSPLTYLVDSKPMVFPCTPSARYLAPAGGRFPTNKGHDHDPADVPFAFRRIGFGVDEPTGGRSGAG